jgi:DNA-binding NarL/FixJ family response regulator
MDASNDGPDGGPAPAVRILIVDDHRTFTDLAQVALAAEPDLECLGAAHDAATARTLATQLQPDVILLDVNLGDDDGLDLAAELLAERPELRIVVLTAHGDARVMRRAASVGACALLPKDGALPELLTTLRTARPGGLVVHPTLLRVLMVEDRDLASAAASRTVTITPQERRVLELLAAGRDVRGISNELGISVHTCRGYVKNILAKLDAHSQLEAVAIARQQGLVA